MEISKKRVIIKFHLLIILFLLISCGKDTNTNTNVITIGNNITDTEAPQCTVKINNDASTTDSIDVTLSLSATDDTGVIGYYISESSSIPSLTGSGWVLTNSTKSYSATVSYSLSSGSGTKTVYIWFRDAADRISTVASDSITFSSSDITAPSSASILINNGDTSTTSTAVTLTLSASDDVGVTGYCAKESSTTPSGNDTCWTTVTSTTIYSATVNFTLSSGSLGDNTKTVYAWFRDTAGNVSSSASDSITLTVSDATAPTSASVSINNSDTSTTSTSVTLTLSTTDDVGVTGYCAKESSATPSGNDSCWASVTSTTSYSTTVSFTLTSGNVGDNTKTVYVWFRDSAGNISQSASANIILTISDTTSPSSPSISINNGDTSTTSTSVTLTLSAADSVGVTGYCAKESSTTPSATDSCWTSVTSTTSYSANVSFTLSSSSGTKTVYAWFRDSAGNVSVVASDSITLAITYKMLKLPDTGQTGDYTTTFGEDSDYTINPPSYTDNGNGTITDNVTSFMWQKEDDNTTRTWSDAITYCDNLSLGGYTDWRLPSKKVLMSIVNYETYLPSIDSTYFPNTDYAYWVSTNSAVYSYYAWYVSFEGGEVAVQYDKSYSYYVRCVRGDNTTPNFTDNGNGTITDNVTGFMWQKKDDNTTRTWESAITYCEGLSLGSYTDWRLPNIKELESITDDTKSNPSIDSTYFPYTLAYYCWSSTTNAHYSSRVWYVYFGDGSVSNGDKDKGYVRCVRGGQ